MNLAIIAAVVGAIVVVALVLGILLVLRARRRNNGALESFPSPAYGQPAMPYPSNPPAPADAGSPPPPPPPAPAADDMPPPPARVPTSPRPQEAGPPPPASEIDRPTVIRSRSSLPVSLDPVEIPPQATVVRPRPEEPPGP